MKEEPWQKLDSKQVFIACDQHLERLQSLPRVTRQWNVVTATEDELKKIKVCSDGQKEMRRDRFI